MLERVAMGEFPAKPHLAFRSKAGELRYEECMTRAGFEGPYTIAYHVQRPHESRVTRAAHGSPFPEAFQPSPAGSSQHETALLRRHYRTSELSRTRAAPLDARLPLLFNQDVVIGMVLPDRDDPVYFVNGDGDDLFFILEGGGMLRTLLGDLEFGPNDYVCVPKGILHRFVVSPGVRQTWFSIECLGGVSLPKQYRNEVGQLVMGAPYSHRDFRKPTFRGPLDEGLREVVVKRIGAFHGYALPHSPLDVVGWDGSVYPWAFPILNFQPRVSSLHLPPTVHATFAAKGALICSFVPRPLDFHPEAVPCPYPHSSVDIDEVLFYAAGNFTSRRGVGVGSISHHPPGIPHGPHPGAYEASIGVKHTDELAVMLDCAKPLARTGVAAGVEDAGYHESFNAS